MNPQEIQNFKDKLLAEKARLESALEEVGQKNPQNPSDWQATTNDIQVDSADDNEVADKFEEFEGNTGIVNKLEKQLVEVDAALDRIEKKTYGICETCGKPIEKDRLEANPSARTSIKHSH
ncbi:MAG: TraR/DksA C4-type zinc finger protein [Candidatus Paceibacterota bacterium]|jgi:RNA polymerase-binding protein DksA